MFTLANKLIFFSQNPVSLEQIFSIVGFGCLQGERVQLKTVHLTAAWTEVKPCWVQLCNARGERAHGLNVSCTDMSADIPKTFNQIRLGLELKKPLVHGH